MQQMFVEIKTVLQGFFLSAPLADFGILKARHADARGGTQNPMQKKKDSPTTANLMGTFGPEGGGVVKLNSAPKPPHL
jgi:hypothetical protein